MTHEPEASSIDWEQQRGHVNLDLLRENAELRANNARLREGFVAYLLGKQGKGFYPRWFYDQVEKCIELGGCDREDLCGKHLRIAKYNFLISMEDLASSYPVLAETPAASLEAIRAEERESCGADTKRLEWLMRNISGRALREIEVIYSAGTLDCFRTAIDDEIRARGDGGEKAG